MKLRIGIIAALSLLAIATVVFGSILWAEPHSARAARSALAAGRYDEALVAASRWMAARPDSPEATYIKGRATTALGNLNEAADLLKRAQALGHPRRELLLFQALIAAKLGRHAEAEPALREAFEMQQSPDHQVDEALARAYLETYRLGQSVAVLKVWARDFPSDAKPHLWWAEIHSRTADEQSLVEGDYRRALQRDPSSARARLGLAKELGRTHRAADAAAEYDACLALDPKNAAAHLGAGRILMELGDEAGAVRHLERAIEFDPKNAEPHIELAAAATRRRDETTALAHLDRAIALDPFDVAARQSRVLALARLGRHDQARAEQTAANQLRKDLDRLNALRARLVQSPEDWNSQVQVAQWMFDHSHEEEGARWALKILAEKPDEPEASRLLAGYHDRRGETGLANFYRLRAQAPTEPAGSKPKAEERQPK